MSSRRICPFAEKILLEIYLTIETYTKRRLLEQSFLPVLLGSEITLREPSMFVDSKPFCCKECYKEYEKYDKITDKMASIAIPIGIIAGIAFTIYMRNFKNHTEWGIESIFAYVFGIILGVLVCSTPTIIVNLAHRKKFLTRRYVNVTLQDSNSTFTMRIVILITMLSMLLLTSCNNSRIEELETSNQQLENHIMQFQAENHSLKEMVEEMQNDMYEIKRYANSASNNTNSAAFWSQSEDSFLFESNIRNMSSDFSNISRIASKY